MITLYVDGYFVNQWDASIYAALVEKGVEFSTARALLRDGGGVPPALRARTGVARVPAFQHGDFWLTESSAIIEYLEETCPGPRLLPADPRGRARARQIMSYVRFDVWRLRDEREFWTCVYPAPSQPPLSREGERDAQQLVALATHVLAEGAPWSIAYVDLALTLLRLRRTDYPLPDAVASFVDEQADRPSVRAYLQHPRPPNPPPRQLSAG